MEAVIGCLLHAGALKQNDLSVECLIRTVDGISLERSVSWIGTV